MLFHSHITTKRRTFELREGVAAVDGLESHDRILILGSAGIFICSIFNFAGAVGLLFRASSIDHERLIFASFAFIYASFQIVFIWLMTSFLLIVQRQLVRGVVQSKWTLICFGVHDGLECYAVAFF